MGLQICWLTIVVIFGILCIFRKLEKIEKLLIQIVEWDDTEDDIADETLKKAGGDE